MDDEPDFLGGGDAVQTKPVEKKAKKALPPPPAKTTVTVANAKVVQKAVSNDIFDLDFLGGTEPTNNAPATNNNAQANLMAGVQAQAQPVQAQQQAQFGMQQQGQFGGMQGQQQAQFGMQQQGQFGGMHGQQQQQQQQQGQFGGMQGQQQGQFGMQQQGQFGMQQQGQQQGQFGGMQQQAQPKQTQFGTGVNLITFDKDPKPAEEIDDDFSNFVTAEEEERKKEQQKVTPILTKLKPLRYSKATPLINRICSI